MMGNAPKRIWATMMDPDCARSGTFVDCAEYPAKPNADAVKYIRDDLGAPSWQPISTAPDKNTPVIGLFKNGAMAIVLYYFYPGMYPADEPDKDGYYDWGESPAQHILLIHPSCDASLHDECREEMTHWMPLPAPPEGK